MRRNERRSEIEGREAEGKSRCIGVYNRGKKKNIPSVYEYNTQANDWGEKKWW